MDKDEETIALLENRSVEKKSDWSTKRKCAKKKKKKQTGMS